MIIQADDNPQQAFAAAYDQYADAIFRHCYFRVFNRERGKELMQETFLRAWEYVSQGNNIDKVQAFLYRIANNLIIDEARRKSRRQEASLEALQEEGFDPGSEEEELQMQHRLDGDQVLDTIRQVEQPYRDVLIMRYVDNLSPADIASITGESANVVSVRIHRGMKKLLHLLGE